jgi:cold shock protein
MFIKPSSIYIIVASFIISQFLALANPAELDSSNSGNEYPLNSTESSHQINLQNCLIDTVSYQLPEGDNLKFRPLSHSGFYLPVSCDKYEEGISWRSNDSRFWNFLSIMYFVDCDLIKNQSNVLSPAFSVLDMQMQICHCNDLSENFPPCRVRYLDVKNPYPGVIAYCASVPDGDVVESRGIHYCGIEYCAIVNNNTMVFFISGENSSITLQFLKNLDISVKKERNLSISNATIFEEKEIVNEDNSNIAPITGTVKFFNNPKGFGFIAGDDGRDYFIHSDGLMEGVSVEEGDRVSFCVTEGEKGLKAINVTPI